MKKILFTAVIFSALMTMAASAAERHMELDYKEIENSDIIVINDIDYMPVRTVAEAMGLNVDWQQDSKTVIISNGGPLYITFTIGINGYTFAKTAPAAYTAEPILENGSTYIPVETFKELIGCDIRDTETAYNIITIYN